MPSYLVGESWGFHAMLQLREAIVGRVKISDRSTFITYVFCKDKLRNEVYPLL